MGEPFDALLDGFDETRVGEGGVGPVFAEFAGGQVFAGSVGEFGCREDGWVDDGVDVIFDAGG